MFRSVRFSVTLLNRILTHLCCQDTPSGQQLYILGFSFCHYWTCIRPAHSIPSLDFKYSSDSASNSASHLHSPHADHTPFSHYILPCVRVINIFALSSLLKRGFSEGREHVLFIFYIYNIFTGSCIK